MSRDMSRGKEYNKKQLKMGSTKAFHMIMKEVSFDDNWRGLSEIDFARCPTLFDGELINKTGHVTKSNNFVFLIFIIFIKSWTTRKVYFGKTSPIVIKQRLFHSCVKCLRTPRFIKKTFFLL